MIQIVTFDAYGQQQQLNLSTKGPLHPAPPPQIWQNQSQERHQISNMPNPIWAKLGKYDKSKGLSSKNQHTKYDKPKLKAPKLSDRDAK